MGQACGRSAVEIWEWICPAFKGAAYVLLIFKFFLSCQVALTSGKAFYYLISTLTLRRDLPWISCAYHWNTANCQNNDSYTLAIPAEEFLYNQVGQITQTSPDFFYNAYALTPSGQFNWPLAGCTLFAWACCLPVLLFGIRVLPKIMYTLVAATCGLALMLVVRLATLHGSSDGLKYLLLPRFQYSLRDTMRVIFVFELFSGSLFTMASYNNVKHKHIVSCLLAHVYFLLQLILGGCIQYMAVGVLAFAKSARFRCSSSSAFRDTPFLTIAPALSTASAAVFWCLVLFLYFLLSQLSFLFTNSEVVITSLLDAWGSHGVRVRAVFALSFVGLGILVSSLSCTPTSSSLADVIQLMPIFFVSASFIFIFLCVFHFGSRRLAAYVALINGCFCGSKIFMACWSFLLPVLFIIGHVNDFYLFYSSLLNIIPFSFWLLFLLFQLFRVRGSVKTRLLALVRPRSHPQLASRFVWKESWAPLHFEVNTAAEAVARV